MKLNHGAVSNSFSLMIRARDKHNIKDDPSLLRVEINFNLKSLIASKNYTFSSCFSPQFLHLHLCSYNDNLRLKSLAYPKLSNPNHP